MPVFKSLSLRGTIPHDETVVEFIDGLHVVRGSNFSGKSSLFQLFANIVTGEAPYAAGKADRENRGVGIVAFEQNKHSYEIAMNFGNGAMSVREDGLSLEYRRKASAQEKVWQLLPMTLPAFQNFAYLSNDTFPVLLRGQPKMRKELFEQLFDIDTSAQYKYFRALETTNRLTNERISAIDSLRGKPASQRQVDATQRNISALESELAELLPAYNNQLEYDKTEAACTAAIARFPELEEMSIDQLRARFTQLNPDTLMAELGEAEYISEENRIYEDYVHDSKIVNNCDADAVSLLREIYERHNDLITLCKVIASYSHIPDDIITSPPKEVDSSFLQTKLTAVEKKLAALHHADSCPLCGSSLNTTGMRAIMSDMEKELISLQFEIEDLGKETTAARKYASLLRHPLFRKLRPEELLAVISAMQKVPMEVLFFFRKYPTAPAKPLASSRNIDEIRSDLSQCLKMIDAIKAVGKFRRLVTPQDRVDARQIENIQTRINYERDLAAQLQVQARNWSENLSESLKLRRKVRDADVVLALKNIYGPKGLRLARITEAVNTYIDNLNIVSKTVLKSYKFSAEISDSGIKILCDRPSGKSDIRRFSGAEGKLFPILSLMALHPLLPETSRSNVLILDEIEAGMRRDTRRNYVELLPALQQLYSSLWVVTPLDRDEFPIHSDGALYEYAVTMQNGKSRLDRQ